jgi:hypothetical protein
VHDILTIESSLLARDEVLEPVDGAAVNGREELASLHRQEEVYLGLAAELGSKRGRGNLSGSLRDYLVI